MLNFEGIAPQELNNSVEGLTTNDFEYLQSIEGLSPGQWEHLTPCERLETLQTLEDKLAEIQGRQPVPVRMAETPGENGHYSLENRDITLNIQHLESDAPNQRLELIDTIAHEGRHAYQHYAIEHPGFHPNEAQVEAWKENFKDYEDGTKDGLMAYRLQPIEADAWQYGHLVKDVMAFGDMDRRMA